MKYDVFVERQIMEVCEMTLVIHEHPDDYRDVLNEEFDKFLIRSERMGYFGMCNTTPGGEPRKDSAPVYVFRREKS